MTLANGNHETLRDLLSTESLNGTFIVALFVGRYNFRNYFILDYSKLNRMESNLLLDASSKDECYSGKVVGLGEVLIPYQSLRSWQ